MAQWMNIRCHARFALFVTFGCEVYGEASGIILSYFFLVIKYMVEIVAGDVILLGKTNMLRFNHPQEAAKLRKKRYVS